MENKEKEAILAYLEEKGIPYRAFSHPKTDTLPEKLQNDAAAGIENATHCKNLVLANRQKTKFYLLTMPFGKRFRTWPVSRQMASGRLSFAENRILEGILHTHSGMVSPLELIFDEKKEIAFSMDRELKNAELICFHPSDDTVTVVLENKEFFEKFLPAAGIAVNFVNIELVEEETV
jgi:Ala-tRNA(Pro) deacylase